MMADELKPAESLDEVLDEVWEWLETNDFMPRTMFSGDILNLDWAWRSGASNTRPTPPASEDSKVSVSDDLVAEVQCIIRAICHLATGRERDASTRAANMIAALIHRREQQAAETMRERCAQEVEAWFPGNSLADARYAAGDALRKAIRSLPAQAGEGV